MSSPEFRSAQAAYEAGNLEKAYSRYEKVLKKNPRHEQAQAQITEISKKLCEKYSEKARGIVSGEVPTYDQLEKALLSLKEGTAYDYDHTKLEPLKDSYKVKLDLLKRELDDHGSQLVSALNTRNFDEANIHFDFIKTRYSGSPVLFSIELQFANLYISHMIPKLRSQVLAGNMQVVQQEITRINTLGFSPAVQQQLNDEVLRQIVSGLRQMVEGIIAKHHYYEAYLAITESGLESEFSDLLGRVRADGGKFYFSQAKKRISRGDMHRAYLEAVKAQELNSHISGLFEVHKKAYDAVLPGIQQNIAVSAFGSPQERPDAGSQFSEALISYLFRTLPYGINIVERQKIDLLLQEQKRAMKEVGELLKVDMIVTGNVVLMDVDRQEQKSKGITQVKVGEKKILNPEYEALLQAHGKRIERMENVPPKWIMDPQYVNAEFDKGRVIVKGFAGISARIFDTQKGELVYAEQLNAKYQVSDDYQQSIVGSSVEEDLLDLPTDTEVMEKMRANLVPQLAEIIQKEFEKRKVHFVDEAKYFLTRKESKKAMKPLAHGLLYCVKEKVPATDPQFVELRSLIIEQTEKNFL